MQSPVLPRPKRLWFSTAPVTLDIIVTETGSKIKAMKIGTHSFQIPYFNFRLSTRMYLFLSNLQCLQANTFCIRSRVSRFHLQGVQYSRILFLDAQVSVLAFNIFSDCSLTCKLLFFSRWFILCACD